MTLGKGRNEENKRNKMQSYMKGYIFKVVYGHISIFLDDVIWPILNDFQELW